MDAIIYTSNSGTTKQYANLLSLQTGLCAYELKNSEQVKEGADVIYLGWLMAGNVKGYKKAAEKYNVKALVGVGMAKSGTQIEDIKKNNKVTDIPVFTLQGGFDINRLHGIYKLMMRFMQKTAVKALSDKTNRTPDEDEMLDMFLNGANKVSTENLAMVLDWYNSVK